MFSNLIKFFDDFSKNRKTREKVIIKTFAKNNVDLDYANRWNALLFKKKVDEFKKYLTIMVTILKNVYNYKNLQ